MYSELQVALVPGAGDGGGVPALVLEALLRAGQVGVTDGPPSGLLRQTL